MTILEFQRRLSGIDFNTIARLTMRDNKHVWSTAKTLNVIEWYKRFLFLCYLYPSRVLAVPEEVDVMWHTHILITKKYASDCATLFGQFLHHDPEVTGNQLFNASKDTEDLFLRHFGVAPSEDSELSEKVSYCVSHFAA